MTSFKDYWNCCSHLLVKKAAIELLTNCFWEWFGCFVFFFGNKINWAPLITFTDFSTGGQFFGDLWLQVSLNFRSHCFVLGVLFKFLAWMKKWCKWFNDVYNYVCYWGSFQLSNKQQSMYLTWHFERNKIIKVSKTVQNANCSANEFLYNKIAITQYFCNCSRIRSNHCKRVSF